MAGELEHRGPDGVGIYRDGDVGLANTRLSIIDLAGGDQPISNETGRYWVVQNGEVYNFPELMAELKELGHVFRTHCDTEVIVHAFEEWGAGCLERFNGAFALAVWDRERRELLVARDRFGKRPLFISSQPEAFLFASEAKSILRHPASVRRLDSSAVREILSLWVSLPDKTLFEGIRELPPGHYLRVSGGTIIEERRWWRSPLLRLEPVRAESEETLAEELRELFSDAVRIRLRADVPVGAYLSGGVDSSATASVVRRSTSQVLRSFAVNFDDPRFDESAYQKRMADELGTLLTGVRVSGPDIAAAFPDVIWYAEKTILRTAPAPLFALSKHVREEGFKVVLTGEGADELFGGYNIFREDKVRRFWARQPESTCRPRLLGRLYPYLAGDLSKAGAFTTAFFGRELTATHHPLYSHRIRFANTARLEVLLRPEHRSGAGEQTPEERLIASLPPELALLSPLKRAQYLETETFLQGYLLHSQGDRMLMGNAVEGRFPFLDYRLAEFAARIPDRMLVRGLREKHLLRMAFEPLLPAEIVRRPKQPYRAPILRSFIGAGAPDYVSQVLSRESLEATGIFDPEAVARLVGKCRANLERGVAEVDEMGLVAIISTELLHQQYIAHPRMSPSATPTREVEGDTVIRRAS